MLNFRKEIIAAAVALSAFFPLSVFAAEPACPEQKHFLVVVEFLNGSDIEGAKISSVTPEGIPSAVGVALTTEDERKAGAKVEGTTVEFTPTVRKDGRISVDVKASKAGKVQLEACTVGASGHRIVLRGDEVAIAITPYDPDASPEAKEIMEKVPEHVSVCSDGFAGRV